MQIGYLKTHKGSIVDNFPKLFTDEFIEQCSWQGANNKIPLKSHVFVRSILYGKFDSFLFFIFCFDTRSFDSICAEVYKEQEESEEKYQRSVQKAINMSRHRVNKKKRTDSKKKNDSVRYLYYD